MKFGVIIFPGSNCDEDMIYVLESIMGQQVERLWHKDRDLKGCEFLVVPGGFSYGDYLRSGAIARFSPIMDEVIAHCNNGGLAMGICNGFQILCEAGLLPGALLRNEKQKFVCKNTYLQAVSHSTILTNQAVHAQPLKIPIAHAEGRYFADEATLEAINANDQILFKYCDANGTVTPEANPNGSVQGIAGVANESKNVFGMMPHPERAADTNLGNIEGKVIFESILEQIPA